MRSALRAFTVILSGLGAPLTPAYAVIDALHVPGDPDARYELLRREEAGRKVWMWVTRSDATGEHELTFDVDCSSVFPSVRWRQSPAQEDPIPVISSRMGKVGQSGIAHDIWNIACISRASPALKASMRFEAFHMGKWALEDRIRDTRPQRREMPLRESNITDAEIRQVTAGARQILPGAVVNIGAVVTGCPCEDGPGCSDQVWLVAYRPDRSIGLLMSKINGTWQIGPVQQWWIDYEALAERRDDESLAEREALEERFPRCEARADAETPAE